MVVPEGLTLAQFRSRLSEQKKALKDAGESTTRVYRVVQLKLAYVKEALGLYKNKDKSEQVSALFKESVTLCEPNSLLLLCTLQGNDEASSVSRLASPRMTILKLIEMWPVHLRVNR